MLRQNHFMLILIKDREYQDDNYFNSDASRTVLWS
jgi:hypothetical protein